MKGTSRLYMVMSLSCWMNESHTHMQEIPISLSLGFVTSHANMSILDEGAIVK